MFKSLKNIGWISLVVTIADFCSLPNVASGAIESFSSIFAPAITTYNSQPIAIQQFDPAFGTLQSVTVKADWSGEFKQFYQNTSTSSPNNVEISQSLHMILSDGVNNLLVFDDSITPPLYSLAVYDGSSPFFTGSSGGKQNYFFARENQIAAPDSTEFIGSGIANLYLSASAYGSAQDSNGNFFGGWNTIAGAIITVSYDYIAVPESSTWLAAVFAVSVLFIGTNKLRLKKR